MKKDTRTLSQVAKAVSAMRKKVAAAVAAHERLQKAIASIQEHKDVFGKFCTVHSTTKETGIYNVTINDQLYATDCTCDGNKKYHMDCLHMLACDRHFDDRRPSFYAGIRKPDFKAARRAAFVQMFNPDMVA